MLAPVDQGQGSAEMGPSSSLWVSLAETATVIMIALSGSIAVLSAYTLMHSNRQI